MAWTWLWLYSFILSFIFSIRLTQVNVTTEKIPNNCKRVGLFIVSAGAGRIGRTFYRIGQDCLWDWCDWSFRSVQDWTRVSGEGAGLVSIPSGVERIDPECLWNGWDWSKLLWEKMRLAKRGCGVREITQDSLGEMTGQEYLHSG